MKKFLQKIILLVILVVASMVCIDGLFLNIVSPQYLYGYDASIIDKINRIEMIEEPKIILVGNSNLAFGIDSEKIENSVGMPVVNLGLHGSLGNEFHESMAKKYIEKNDIVIVSHTDFDEYDRIVDPVLAWTVIENHYDLWGYVSHREYGKMFMAFPTYMNKAFFLFWNEEGNQRLNGIYTRNAFNKYGDNIYPRGKNETDFSADEYISIIGKDFIKRINQLNNYCKNKGATLLVAAYPICVGQYTPDRAEYEIFQDQLQKEIDCTVISDYRNYMLDYKYFYGNVLHLNDAGVSIRTELLIDDLLQWIEKKNECTLCHDLEIK